MTKKIAFKTLGCRLNLFETDAIASAFSKEDYELVDFDSPADVYVINTCTVTNQSDSRSRRVIKQARRINKEALTIVTGCMATNYKEQLQQNEQIDYVVDNDHKTSVFSVVESHYKGELVKPDQFDKDLFGYAAADETFHTRSLIKIQDGCDNFCTFCIIPKVRGRATSRPAENIFENIRKVIDFGFKEIVLTGVNLGRYNYKDYNFEKLVEEILEIPGDFRVRISSIEPDGYSDSFFRLFAHPKLTPHMHICLQSGSEDILLKMRRMYTAKLFGEMAAKLKASHPGFNLTTDVIVGFPGETEEDFKQTLQLAKQIGFGHIHTFKYSVRKGTRAERMTEQVPEKLKTQRSEIIRQLAEEMKLGYRKTFVGKTQKVLVEKINEDGFATGFGEHYVPVIIRKQGLEKNSFYEVLINGLTQSDEPILTGAHVNQAI
ncbi:MAG: tRNA (N(6)-L-threonylcarbamoyladenosine(37)-C(2))-methylthiotransferase MtaB [Bacteroidales bacterium]|nr:tRNA (N(6)-L-threonylcarbamoyladenosine(37)-C(2))-methylthiotransferase MtaB [Bacteroidales bacterium]MCF6341618.1 tRNA (N(6)-L-threonylcarbamoyladenosine(37)-C(2))-methylthiotransferase MtaB [Bacteroidales bacterium]